MPLDKAKKGEGFYHPYKPTFRSRAEKLLAEMLDQLNIKYQHERPLILITSNGEIKRYRPDFTLSINGRKIIIQCDGIYWHNKTEAIARDTLFNELSEEVDIEVIRVFSEALTDNWLSVYSWIYEALASRTQFSIND
jgi:very-short-patch-repair endonuclease